MECYHFVECKNLEEIVQRELRKGIKYRGLNPRYYVNGGSAHSKTYLLSVLPLLLQSVDIIMAMIAAKWFDADISPDQFILLGESKTSRSLRKIDHESMIQFTAHNSVQGSPCKPMKAQFMAPEMENVDGVYTAFDVEKASVYMMGAVIVYVLFGQFVNAQCVDAKQWSIELLPSNWKWIQK